MVVVNRQGCTVELTELLAILRKAVGGQLALVDVGVNLAEYLGTSVSTLMAMAAFSCSQFSFFAQLATVLVGMSNIAAMSRCDLSPLIYKSLTACFVFSEYFILQNSYKYG